METKVGETLMGGRIDCLDSSRPSINSSKALVAIRSSSPLNIMGLIGPRPLEDPNLSSGFKHHGLLPGYAIQPGPQLLMLEMPALEPFHPVEI